MVALHAEFLYIICIDFNSLAPATNKGISPLLVQCQFQFCSKQLHFCNNLAITPKLSPTDGISVGSKEVEV
jgi:hypothetical protein